MISKARLLVVLALAATSASCLAGPLADGRSAIKAKVHGHQLLVPVYEDKDFTKEIKELGAWYFESAKDNLLELAKLVIVERSSPDTIKKIPDIIKEYMRVGFGSSKYDFSPLVESVLNTKTDLTELSDEEIYGRIETFLDSMDKAVQESPVGSYPDWNKLTIDDESLGEYLSPVIHWLRNNNFHLTLKVLGALEDIGRGSDLSMYSVLREMKARYV